MNRFFVEPEKIIDGVVHFPSDIAHQIMHVLRLSQDDQVLVLDNNGSVHKVVLYKGSQKTLYGKIIKTEEIRVEDKPSVTLFFGMTSREKVEWILQKGTEVGVSAFQPFISSRTLVQSMDLSEKKILRWKTIIREAAEQSGRSFLPELNAILDFESAVETACMDHNLCLLAWERSSNDCQSITKAISGINQGPIALLVGPEGGFTEEEVRFAQGKGSQVASLGKEILRMETAAIVFPALVLYELSVRNFRP